MEQHAPNLELDLEAIKPREWEQLLLNGWDRVGRHFFKRRFDYFQVTAEPPVFSRHELLPLRYRLTGWRPTKSQRLILKKNEDLTCEYAPAELTEEKLALFNKWYYARFGFYSSIFTWVTPDGLPLPQQEVTFRDADGRLVACSFFDLTPRLQYSLTAFFDPSESRRSLGMLTLLAEIRHGIETGRRFHYPGHAYRQRSMYEYKKNFNNMEGFDWEVGNWRPLERQK